MANQELKLSLKTKQTAAILCSTCFIEKNFIADGWKVAEWAYSFMF